MSQIGAKQLAQLCRRVGVSLHAGVDVRRIWQQEGERGPWRQREASRAVAEAIGRGRPLAEAMQSSGGFFPSLVCEMVQVGEHTGKIDDVFLRLADQYDHVVSLRRTFLIGIMWPAIQLSLGVFVIGGFTWVMGEIVPRMQDGSPVFDLLGIGVGNQGLLNYIAILMCLAGAAAFAYYGLSRGWLGTAPISLLMRTPVIGQSLQTLMLSRMAWALAMANDAGMDARQSVSLALRSTQNPYYMSQSKKIDNHIMRGLDIHTSFRQAGVFPDEFLYVVENGEESGTLPESLLKLSQEYRRRSETSSKALTMLGSFLIWGLVGMIMIYFIFRLAFFYIGAITPGAGF